MQFTVSFLVKVNRTQANTILDASTGQVADNAKDIVSESNNALKITQIRWLSKIETRKLHGSILICLEDKNQLKLFLKKVL